MFRPGKIPIEVHRFGTILPCTITLNAEEESDILRVLARGAKAPVGQTRDGKKKVFFLNASKHNVRYFCFWKTSICKFKNKREKISIFIFIS